MTQHLLLNPIWKSWQRLRAVLQQRTTPEVGKHVQECPLVAWWLSSGPQQCGNNYIKALNKDHRQVWGVLGGPMVQKRSKKRGIKKEEDQNQGLDLETAAAHQCRASMGPKNRAQSSRRAPSLSTHLLGGKMCSDKATEGKGCGLRTSWWPCRSHGCCWRVNSSRMEGKYGTEDYVWFWNQSQGNWSRNNLKMEMFAGTVWMQLLSSIKMSFYCLWVIIQEITFFYFYLKTKT